MQLKPLFIITVELGENKSVGDMGRGTRSIAEITGGTFEGEKLRGEVMSPAADWLVTDSTGMGQIDVRLTLATDDGCNIYMHYTGVLELNETVLTAVGGGAETDFGDNYFFTQPRFESGSEKYAWLNNTIAIAQGRLLPGAIQYQVYGCSNKE